MFGLDLLTPSQVTDRSGDLKNAKKDMLYTAHAFPEFVPVVTIKWDGLAGIRI